MDALQLLEALDNRIEFESTPQVENPNKTTLEQVIKALDDRIEIEYADDIPTPETESLIEPYESEKCKSQEGDGHMSARFSVTSKPAQTCSAAGTTQTLSLDGFQTNWINRPSSDNVHSTRYLHYPSIFSRRVRA